MCGGDPRIHRTHLPHERLFPACAGVIPPPEGGKGGALLFPACAGVIPYQNFSFPLEIPFPRMCGGDPRAHYDRIGITVFSPHVRG